MIHVVTCWKKINEKTKIRRQAGLPLTWGIKTPQTLANQRAKRIGPNYIKLGRRILYDVADLDAYIDARRVKLDA